MPLDPEVVLTRLDIRLRTPTPPLAEVTTWQSQTPSNTIELSFQSELLRDRIQRHQDSSLTSIIASLDYLIRGA